MQTITATPLTPTAFSPFGSVLQHTSEDEQGRGGGKGTLVNSGTAQKLHLSSIATGAPPSGRAPNVNVHVFACSPRARAGEDYVCSVLERHRYSSQAFVPMGGGGGQEGKARYLVIVAPTMEGEGGPDVCRARAFLADAACQGVVYAMGTWHAPMAVVGEVGDGPMKFVVVVAENGVPEEDTQEVEVSDGGVVVKLSKD